MQMHDILGGDKQLVQELLHDMKQKAASQRHAAAAPAATVASTQAGKWKRSGHEHASRHPVGIAPFCPHREQEQRGT